MIKQPPQELTEVYSVHDDAWDPDKSDFDQYAETLEPTHLVLRDGATPTTFLLGVTTRSRMRLRTAVLSMMGISSIKDMDEDRYAQHHLQITSCRFRALVQDVKNGPQLPDRDGQNWLPESALDLFPLDVIEEIATYGLSLTDPTLLGGSGGSE